MEQEACPVCRDEQCEGREEPMAVHTLVRQMQPSDYRLDEFYREAASTLGCLLDEAGEGRWADIEAGADKDARAQDDDEEADWASSEFAEEVLGQLQDLLPKGYVIWSDSDYWSIWRV